MPFSDLRPQVQFSKLLTLRLNFAHMRFCKPSSSFNVISNRTLILDASLSWLAFVLFYYKPQRNRKGSTPLITNMTQHLSQPCVQSCMNNQQTTYLFLWLRAACQFAHETRQKGQQNENFFYREDIKSLDGYVIRNHHLLIIFERPASCSLGSFIYSKYAELSHLPRVLMVASRMPLLAAVDTALIRKLCPE